MSAIVQLFRRLARYNTLANDRLYEACAALTDLPLLDLVLREDLGEQLDETAFTQPALFALAWAGHQMWTAFGVQPAALLGHSIGELVAATAAGVFTLEEGLRLAIARGRLMQACRDDGRMIAVDADAATVSAALPSPNP